MPDALAGEAIRRDQGWFWQRRSTIVLVLSETVLVLVIETGQS